MYLIKYLLIVAGLLVTANAHAQQRRSIHTHTDQRAFFIQNKGQVTDQYHQPRHDVAYQLRDGKGVNIFLSPAALHYQFYKPEYSKETVRLDGKTASRTPVRCTLYRIDMELAGADSNAQATAGDKQDYYENYYLPQTQGGSSFTQAYGKITWQHVYDGTDWVIYKQAGKIKYDFIVRKTDGVAAIRIKYKGATDVKKTEAGGLEITSPLGKITEDAPVAYEAETGKKIPCRWVQKGDTWGFAVAAYNGTLVIDPGLDWGTYYGGENYDGLGEVTTDAAGNAYVTGYTNSYYQIATTGAYQTVISYYTGPVIFGYTYPPVDGLIVKFSPAGWPQWATYYGGESDDGLYGISSDQSGNIYASGWSGMAVQAPCSSCPATTTISSMGIATPGAFQTTPAHYFLVKFNAAGIRQWATYDSVGGVDISTDKWGNSYLVNGIYTSNYNYTVTKYNASGSRLWKKTRKGAGYTIAADPEGSGYYVAGLTRPLAASDTSIITPNAHQTAPQGGFYGDGDAFLIRFDTSGRRKWGTYYGGAGDDKASALVTGPGGAVYMTGTTNSDYNIATAGSHQSTLSLLSGSVANQDYDDFIVRFDTTGKRIWGTYFGGVGYEDGSPWLPGISGPYIAANSCGDVYTTGVSRSFSGIATPDGYDTSRLAGVPASLFIAQFNGADGKQRWGSYYGHTYFRGSTGPRGIACDAKNNLFIAGVGGIGGNGTAQYPPSGYDLATPGSYMDNPHTGLGYWGDETDGWLVRWQEVTIGNFPDTLSVCDSLSFDLPYETSDTFRTGNIFSAELSDTSGNFYNPAPIVIGTRPDSVSGTIHCVLPASLVTGYYLIRVSSSSPKSSGACWRVIKYDKKPLPPYVVSPVNYCVGQKADSLLATSSGQGYQLYWYSSINATPQFTAPYPKTDKPGDITWYVSQLSQLGICMSDKSSIKVHVYPVPRPAFSLSDTMLCLDETLTVRFSDSNYADNVYVWNFSGAHIISGNAEGPYTLSWPAAGVYQVSLAVSNHNCAIKPDTAHISVMPMPETKISYTGGRPCYADTIVLAASGGTYYDWHILSSYTAGTGPLDSAIHVTALPGIYTVTGYNIYGCHSADSLQIITQDCCRPPFIPDAFTPNGDGRNDVLLPIGYEDFDFKEFRIYNRWGICVFNANGRRVKGWDGTVNGIPAEMGTYYYMLSGNCATGRSVNLKGDITLIR